MYLKTYSYSFLGGEVLRVIAAGCITFCCLLNAAQAQTAPDAGSILRELQRPMLDLPPRVPPSIKRDEPARPAAKPSAMRFVLKRVWISGNAVFPQPVLLELLQDTIGKEVGFAELEAAAARITRYYRERGYLVARAYLPAQDIQNNTVEIAVIEGRYGKVEINNSSHVRDSVLRQHTATLPGDVVYELKLERQLLLINDLAGVGEARAALRPGANVGESDLVIEVTPAPRVTGSVEIDNHGNRFAGANRATARLNLPSLLGLGDTLSGAFTKGFSGLDYGRINYQLPLGGDGLKAGAAYSHSRYRLGKTFAPLNADGESDAYTLSLAYPIVRSRNFNLYGQAAYEGRDFQDRVGLTATVADKSTRAASFTLSGDLRDVLVQSGISVFSVSYGTGNVNIASPAALAIDSASARTQGHFDKWNFNLLRLQSLSEQLSAYVSFSAQKANQNLDSSEKFLLGGANGVRAYPSGSGMPPRSVMNSGSSWCIFTSTGFG